MTDIRPNSNLAFDRGIVSITHMQQQEALVMPARSETSPPDSSVSGRIDQLLQANSMDSQLDANARPPINDRSLLIPANFNKALEGTSEHLRKVVQDGSQTAEESRVINRAVRLLGDESGLRSLVQMYRSALYQG